MKRVLAALAALVVASAIALGGASSAAASSPFQWRSVSAGGGSTCAVDVNFDLYCWGFNQNGQVGDGTTTNRTLPVQIGTAKWLSVRTSTAMTCGIQTDRTAWCWGYNLYGQVGNDAPGSAARTPQKVAGNMLWSKIAPGFDNVCGISTLGALYCWGSDQYGGIGDGAPSSTTAKPKRVGAGKDWKAVTLGYYHSCALKTDKTAWCWGQADQGATGTGKAAGYIATPRKIAGTWKKLSAQALTSCGITTTGVTRCWGRNTDGQLGDNTTQQRNTPTTLAAQSATFSQIQTGFDFTCGLRIKDSAIRCFGSNDDRQFGNGNATGSRAPAAAAAAKTDWTAYSVGEKHGCGIRESGKLYCWGKNSEGSLGVGNTGTYFTPQQAGIAQEPPN